MFVASPNLSRLIKYDNYNALFTETNMQPLEQLYRHGFLLGIATGRSTSITKDLDSSRLSSYVLATRCGGETSPKPHPQMLLEIMGELWSTAIRNTYGWRHGKRYVVSKKCWDRCACCYLWN